jgi:glycosyltransferase involved in cell wall biosynthesis
LKILFSALGGIYPFVIGGPQVVAYNLVKQFDRKGIDVDFVFGISKEQFKKVPDMNTFLELSENVKLTPLIKNQWLPSSYNMPPDLKFISDSLKLTRKINNDVDIIHFHYVPDTKDLLLLFLSRLKKIPCIYRSAGWLTYEAYTKANNRSIYFDYFSYRFLSRYFDGIATNSSYLKRKIMLEGINEERIEPIPNGVDVARFKNAKKIFLPGDPALLFVGRLVPIKGVEVLVRSMNIICKELPYAVLHLVGDGPSMNTLTTIVQSNNLQKNVVFHGNITRELPSFYASAHICIFPSLYEPFGIINIEAMAAGKPIITTNRGGVSENIKHLENGLVLEPTEKDIAAGVIKLWNNKDLMKTMIRNNSKKAKDFDWSKTADRYVDFYQRIIERGCQNRKPLP